MNKMLDSGKMKNHEIEVEGSESRNKNKVDGIEENMESRLGEDVCENKMLDCGKMKSGENEMVNSASRNKNKIDGDCGQDDKNSEVIIISDCVVVQTVRL